MINTIPFPSSHSWTDITFVKEIENIQMGIVLRQRSSSVCSLTDFETKQKIDFKNDTRRNCFNCSTNSKSLHHIDIPFLDMDACESKKINKCSGIGELK